MFARQRARADAEQAALLGEEEVTAALRLRRLEVEAAEAADGLARLRGQAAAAEAALAGDEVGLKALLPIMQRLSAAPAATILAVPEGPVDSVRGILVLQAVAGEIQVRAARVRAEAAVVARLSGEVARQQVVLAGAVAAEGRAETALTEQIGEARAAELADADIAVAEAAAAAAANVKIQNLEGMVSAVQGAAPDDGAAAAPFAGFAPVAGTIVENFGDPTAAGPAEGVTYEAAPGARVVAPCAGPVLFADNFKSYGLLVILGCGAGTDFTLSGMHRLDVVAGEKVARGQPLGQMAGLDPLAPANKPRLYVEFLQNGAPVSPASWVSGGGSG
jgi:septal ring factor EnvC (AmiA/AmiB activator)